MTKFLKLLILLIAVLGFLVSTRTVDAQYFSLSPKSATKKINEQFVVDINIHTEGKEIKGGDAKITYDPALLEVVSVENGRFTGLIPAENVPKGGYNVDNGIIYISYGFDSPTEKSSGTGTFAKLTLKGKVAGTASLVWDCSSQTSDSNIIDINSADIIVCSKTTNGTYVITEGSSPEPTPTPVPDDGGGDDGDGDDDGGGGTDVPAATATPVIPVSGITTPTIFGIGAGAILTILGIALAL